MSPKDLIPIEYLPMSKEDINGDIQVIAEVTKGVSQAIQATTNWLETREKRKALEFALKVEVKRLKTDLLGLRDAINKDLKVLKTQVKDNAQARERISHIATELINKASNTIDKAIVLSKIGNQEMAKELIKASVNMINSSTEIIKAKFPSSIFDRQ